MNIFLLGYMGSGKSTTGRLLAKKLGMSFVDLDDLIEKSEEITIEGFFEEQGEEKFRELEHRRLKHVIENKNTVIALGGGTPCYHNNMELIKKSGISVYLQMPASALMNRLMNARVVRPLIKNKTEKDLLTYIEGSLLYREKFYLQADKTVNALNLNVEMLIDNLPPYCKGKDRKTKQIEDPTDMQ